MRGTLIAFSGFQQNNPDRRRYVSKNKSLSGITDCDARFDNLGFAASERKISFSNDGNKVQLMNNTETGFELQFTLQDFSVEEVSTRGGVYDRLAIDGFGYSGRIGEPQLPVFSKLIAVPLGAQVQIEFFKQKSAYSKQNRCPTEESAYPCSVLGFQE